MRLVGMALLAAWLMAWAVAPHGEVARSTSVVGAVAVAGGDDAALAWLELRYGSGDGTLHVVTVDGRDRVTDRLHVVAGADATAFRLADAGERVFVLATERKSESGRSLEFHRFGPGVDDFPPALRSEGAGAWQMAAAGDELLVAEKVGDQTRLSFLRSDGTWGSESWMTGDRVLVGAGGGHTVFYVAQSDRAGFLGVAWGRPGEWSAQVGKPACFSDGGRAPTITSVIGLPGGYARLSRRGREGCVDGVREGRPFAQRDVPLDGIAAARLALGPPFDNLAGGIPPDAGRLSVYEEQDAQVTRRRVILPERPGGEMVIDPRTVAEGLPDEGVRYRLFGGEGSRGLTTLATRVADHQTEVVLERGAGASARVLAPIKRYQPDHRPVLRPLALVPLAMLFLSALGSWRLGARLRRIAPSRPDAPLPSGPAVVEGELAADADAPAGGLWLRRGRGRMAIFVEGAEVVRASDVRPRTQPRGDAVDVAEGAPAVATGLVEPGVLYRDVATLRARRGDLLLVGCSLAEARAWIARRTFGTVALLTFATSLVAALTFAR